MYVVHLHAPGHIGERGNSCLGNSGVLIELLIHRPSLSPGRSSPLPVQKEESHVAFWNSPEPQPMRGRCYGVYLFRVCIFFRALSGSLSFVSSAH